MLKFGLVLLLAASISGQSIDTKDGKIKITTVTTAGCGDTVHFITQRLNPVFNEYKDYLELEFIPWGRTRRNSDGSLTCQFGTRDCWANRVHRCTLNLLKGDQAAQMSYMNCEFSDPRPAYLLGSYTCAGSAGVSLVDLDRCVSTSEGDDLEYEAQEAAAAPMQAINFVPAIVFNDEINYDNHFHARGFLRSMICFALERDPAIGIKCVL
ncbi:hypothetical protein JYU34_017620 [Plutella xylostella]|uniref:Uncharacterized protein n=2 Tax=Plutella xylostella TaxID=51655 RepID=A0ABQ7Q1L2_PLUXY|nr:hypothetical protein JYU34_017620 [Plutella xylostella]CAG9134878.1 unnamed protein product [Plutella xylostella]